LPPVTVVGGAVTLAQAAPMTVPTGKTYPFIATNRPGIRKRPSSTKPKPPPKLAWAPNWPPPRPPGRPSPGPSWTPLPWAKT